MLQTELLHPTQIDAARALSGVAGRCLGADDGPERLPHIVRVYQEVGTGHRDTQLAFALAAAGLDGCRTLIIRPSALVNELAEEAERARELDAEVTTVAHAPGAGGDAAAAEAYVLLSIAPRVKGSLDRRALDEDSFDIVIVDEFDAATTLTAEVAGCFGASLYVFWSGARPDESHACASLSAGSAVIQGPAKLLGVVEVSPPGRPEPPPAYTDTRWTLRHDDHNPLGLSTIYAEPGAGVGTILQMGARSPADAEEQFGNARIIVAATNLFITAARAHSANAVLLAERLEQSGFADLFDGCPQLAACEGVPPAYTPLPWRLYTDPESKQGLSQITSRYCRFVSIIEMFAHDESGRDEQVGNARLVKAAAGAVLKTAEMWDVNPVLLAESLQDSRLVLSIPLYRGLVNNC
ncbi:MAG: hypothetical protein ACJ74Q_15230 [Pyrinomonadaceae bacterium]